MEDKPLLEKSNETEIIIEEQNKFINNNNANSNLYQQQQPIYYNNQPQQPIYYNNQQPQQQPIYYNNQLQQAVPPIYYNQQQPQQAVPPVFMNQNEQYQQQQQQQVYSMNNNNNNNNNNNLNSNYEQIEMKGTNEKGGKHCASLIISLIGIGSFIGLIVSIAIGSSVGIGVCATIVAIVEIALIIELCCFSSTMKSLKNKGTIEEQITLVDRIREQKPKIGMHVECYHYEMRTRTVTSTTYNSQTGKHETTFRTETYQEKVVTHTETKYFQFKTFTDTSANIDFSSMSELTVKLTLTKEWNHGDSKTEKKYQKFEKKFRQQNQNRDTHCDFIHLFEVDHFQPYLLIIPHPSKLPFAMKRSFFVFATLLFFSWPYRLWFDSQCRFATFQIKKTIFY
eukprot:TRINITY_DN2360_c0_g2_i3.p1 TRINITY_DN2360_c0_g2~~TRINITY_DN2360_c0_g2_i3.p1  ORF type:complete len:395 (+),score=132.14 TRINITY_DN2360_c0_g2_i3:46-1230(+)